MNDDSAKSVGELLRAARERKEISIEEVNRHTKISVQVLKSLEQDDFESFESDIYLKGFLKSYARFLNLDVEDIIMTLERQRGGAINSRGALWDIEETFTEEALKSPKILARIILPILIIIVLVLSFLLIRMYRQGKEIGLNGSGDGVRTESIELRA